MRNLFNVLFGWNREERIATLRAGCGPAIAAVLIVALLLIMSHNVYGATPVEDYASFRAAEEQFYADLGDIPPDNFLTDAAALVSTYYDTLWADYAATVDECWADRFAAHLYGILILEDALTAPYGYDVLADRLWDLADLLLGYSYEVPVTC